MQNLRFDTSLIIESCRVIIIYLTHKLFPFSGTYPYVTSSSCSIGGVCIGLGLAPKHIDEVYGVCMAYTVRLSNGIFPTELKGEYGEYLLSRGEEICGTDGDFRRCGWLDLVILKHTHMVNGYTALCLTKLDVLDELPAIKVATAYEQDGVELKNFPASIDMMDNIKVQYETLPGWRGHPISLCRTFDSLPENARNYVHFIANFVGVPGTQFFSFNLCSYFPPLHSKMDWCRQRSNGYDTRLLELIY
ncbi:unnamed protein product [Rotaria socialis]|uniref:Adenylosuccinate synthetase n=1 Tax=Rotaria socialis TaxID=392032 RepID=A0A821WDZ8_9BILA|nr:unnamed protein product [Rotaria socialis]CAF4921233.1 unnamed protein product [Rotaria socialis]